MQCLYLDHFILFVVVNNKWMKVGLLSLEEDFFFFLKKCEIVSLCSSIKQNQNEPTLKCHWYNNY